MSVVDFYGQGGRAKDEYGRSPDVRPLELSDPDRADLVAFLRSLSSELDFCRPDEAVIVPGRPLSSRGAQASSAARRSIFKLDSRPCGDSRGSGSKTCSTD